MDKNVPCSNKDCPYGLEAYNKPRILADEHDQYDGLCLNCIQDEKEQEDVACLSG